MSFAIKTLTEALTQELQAMDISARALVKHSEQTMPSRHLDMMITKAKQNYLNGLTHCWEMISQHFPHDILPTHNTWQLDDDGVMLSWVFGERSVLTMSTTKKDLSFFLGRLLGLAHQWHKHTTKTGIEQDCLVNLSADVSCEWATVDGKDTSHIRRSGTSPQHVLISLILKGATPYTQTPFYNSYRPTHKGAIGNGVRDVAEIFKNKRLFSRTPELWKQIANTTVVSRLLEENAPDTNTLWERHLHAAMDCSVRFSLFCNLDEVLLKILNQAKTQTSPRHKTIKPYCVVQNGIGQKNGFQTGLVIMAWDENSAILGTTIAVLLSQIELCGGQPPKTLLTEHNPTAIPMQVQN